MSVIIETNNLLKVYRTKKAVNDVSLKIERGEIYGLVGKNGAGKTTLMKLILGTANPTSGSIKLFGSDDLNSGRKRIGSLIEDPGLYYNCDGYENLKRFSILYGANPEEVPQLLELVGLSNVGKKKVKQYSLGMKQRLGIAVALLGHPELLVLDEPTNGLDPAGIKEVRDIILALNAKGVTFIISSHLIDELVKVVTRFGIIADGVITEEISANDLSMTYKNAIRITTLENDYESLTNIIKNQYPDMELEIKQNSLYATIDYDQIPSFNKYLISQDINVIEIKVINNSLEDYFIKRLG